MLYLKKEVNNEGHLWQAGKQQTFLQLDTIILGVGYQACPKYPKQKFGISFQYLQNSMWEEVDFLPTDKAQNFSTN